MIPAAVSELHGCVHPVPAGQLPWAAKGSVRRMCKQLSVLHDLTNKYCSFRQL